MKIRKFFEDILAKKSAMKAVKTEPAAPSAQTEPAAPLVQAEPVPEKYDNGESIVVIPEGVTQIKKYAFSRNKTVREVILPASVTEIGDFAFSDSTLEKIVLPPGVRKLGYSAFCDCRELSSVILPDQLSYIDMFTFEGCLNLKELVLPKELREVDREAFKNCGLEELRLPEGMTCVGEGAFCGMKHLERLYLPKTLLCIGKGAFEGCNTLKEVRLPEGLLEISERAFEDCFALEKVEFPQTLISVGRRAFWRTGISDSEELKAVCEAIGESVIYPRPEEWKKLALGDMSFYYSSEVTDYSAMGPEKGNILERSGLVCDRRLTDSFRLFHDGDGRPALCIFESIPTFDSSDREWGSYQKLYLLPGEGKLRGILVRGGYKLARVLVYEDIRYGDSSTEKLVESYGGSVFSRG